MKTKKLKTLITEALKLAREEFQCAQDCDDTERGDLLSSVVRTLEEALSNADELK